MEGDADAVDALFAEAFALLESASPPPPPAQISSSSSSSSSSPSPSWSATSASSSPSISAHVSTPPWAPSSESSSPQAPSSPPALLQLDDALPLATRKRARGSERETSAAKLKRMIRIAKDEHAQLTACVDALRGAVAPPLVALRERAMAAQLERRRAERERDALRAAVYTQKQFLRGMRGFFFSEGSRATLSVNLCHQLHNFTRLPRDKSIRQHEYAALRREERVHAAIALLLRETDAISNARDFVDATFVHAPGEPSAITSTSVFVMDDHDVPTVLRAACVAVRDIVLRCRSYNWVGVAGEIVDADALSASELQYRVTSVRQHSSAIDRDPSAFSVESRALTMYRMVGDAAVVLWDFVDEDELHPTDDEPPDVTRQSVGAALIRRELCPDGVERTVYRELSTRRYTYRGRAWPPPPSVEWYLSTQRLSMQWNELLFREIMLEQIAAEAAATARVAGALSEPILR